MQVLGYKSVFGYRGIFQFCSLLFWRVLAAFLRKMRRLKCNAYRLPIIWQRVDVLHDYETSFSFGNFSYKNEVISL